jgi:hypothetical protein
MKILPYPFIILFTFIITFTLYPGPSFHKVAPGLDNTWSVLVYNLVYAFGDTVGRLAVDRKGSFNKKSLVYIFLARLIFFFPITIMATGADIGDILIDNNVFPFINQFIFAFTNGFCISKPLFM